MKVNNNKKNEKIKYENVFCSYLSFNFKDVMDKEKYKKVKLRLRWEGVLYFFLLGICAIALGVTLIFLKELETVIVGSGIAILGIISFLKILSFNILNAYWLRFTEDSIEYKSLFGLSFIQINEITGIRQRIIPNTTTNNIEIKYCQNGKSKNIKFIQALLPKNLEQEIVSFLHTYYLKSDIKP